MMRLKRISLLLVGVIMFAMLTACGGKKATVVPPSGSNDDGYITITFPDQSSLRYTTKIDSEAKAIIDEANEFLDDDSKLTYDSSLNDAAARLLMLCLNGVSEEEAIKQVSAEFGMTLAWYSWETTSSVTFGESLSHIVKWRQESGKKFDKVGIVKVNASNQTYTHYIAVISYTN